MTQITNIRNKEINTTDKKTLQKTLFCKFDHVGKIKKFSEKHKLPKYMQRERDNLNSCILTTEIEPVF